MKKIDISNLRKKHIKNQWDEIFEKLDKELTNNSLRNESSSLYSQWKDYKSEKTKGTKTDDYLRVTKNQIGDGLLSIFDEIESQVNPSTKSSETKKGYLPWILVIILAFSLLFFSLKKCNIEGFVQQPDEATEVEGIDVDTTDTKDKIMPKDTPKNDNVFTKETKRDTPVVIEVDTPEVVSYIYKIKGQFLEKIDSVEITVQSDRFFWVSNTRTYSISYTTNEELDFIYVQFNNGDTTFNKQIPISDYDASSFIKGPPIKFPKPN